MVKLVLPSKLARTWRAVERLEMVSSKLGNGSEEDVENLRQGEIFNS